MRVEGSEFRVQGSGFGVQDRGWVSDSGFVAWGLGFRAQDKLGVSGLGQVGPHNFLLGWRVHFGFRYARRGSRPI